MDIELATNAELVEELMRRNTFAGLVLFSEQEQKFDYQIHSNFKLLTKTSPEDTLNLLCQAVEAVHTQLQ